MTTEEITKILSEENYGLWEGDNVMQGIDILRKYATKHSIIEGVGHDVIYSVGIPTAAEGGITEEEVRKLRELNWMEDMGSFACFV